MMRSLGAWCFSPMRAPRLRCRRHRTFVRLLLRLGGAPTSTKSTDGSGGGVVRRQPFSAAVRSLREPEQAVHDRGEAAADLRARGLAGGGVEAGAELGAAARVDGADGAAEVRAQGLGEALAALELGPAPAGNGARADRAHERGEIVL